MKVGLMMVIRNEFNRIEDCLDWHLPYFDEVAICDQRSDDGTYRLVEAYLRNQKVPYKLWQDKKWGHCAPSRKPTIDMLSTDWVVNVDADEKFEKDFLEQMHNLAESNKVDGYWLKRKNSFDVQVYDDSIAVQPHWLYVEHPVIEKQFRFYKRDKAVFTDGLHSRAKVGGREGVLGYVIDHRKTLQEMQSDLARFREVNK